MPYRLHSSGARGLHGGVERNEKVLKEEGHNGLTLLLCIPQSHYGLPLDGLIGSRGFCEF